VKVDRSVASIFSFRIDVPLFSESIRLGSELIWIGADNKIELEQEFKLSCLLADKNLGD